MAALASANYVARKCSFEILELEAKLTWAGSRIIGHARSVLMQGKSGGNSSSVNWSDPAISLHSAMRRKSGMTIHFKLEGRRYDSEDGWQYDGSDYWLTDDGILKFKILRGKRSKAPFVLFLLIPLSWILEISLVPSITFLPVLSFFLLTPTAFLLVPRSLRKSERQALERLSPEERLDRANRISWSAVGSASLTPVQIRELNLLNPSDEYWYLLTIRPFREGLPTEPLAGRRQGSKGVQMGVPEETLEPVESFLRSMIGEKLAEIPRPTIGPPIYGNEGTRWKPHAERITKYLARNPKELDKVFAAYDESGLDGVVNYLKEADPDLTGEEADRVAIEIIRDRDKLVRKTKEEKSTVFSSSI